MNANDNKHKIRFYKHLLQQQKKTNKTLRLSWSVQTALCALQSTLGFIFRCVFRGMSAHKRRRKKKKHTNRDIYTQKSRCNISRIISAEIYYNDKRTIRKSKNMAKKKTSLTIEEKKEQRPKYT